MFLGRTFCCPLFACQCKTVVQEPARVVQQDSGSVMDITLDLPENMRETSLQYLIGILSGAYTDFLARLLWFALKCVDSETVR